MPSDDELSFNKNFEAIEDALLADYQDQWGEVTTPVRELLDLEWPIEEEVTLLQDPVSRIDDLKVEIPLMLDSASKSTFAHSEDIFNASMEEFDLDPDFEMEVLADIPDDCLGENFRKAAEDGARRAEQEQLQHIDAVARIPIPVMDFSVSEPSWAHLRMNERGIWKWIQAGREELFRLPSWTVHKADESKLTWTPLCGNTVLTFDETMDEGEDWVDAFIGLNNDKEQLTSAEFVHSTDHFVVLQNDDEDEEIETQLAEPKPQRDLMAIVGKRLNEGDGDIARKRPRHDGDAQRTGLSVKSDGRYLLLGNSSDTSGKFLANFMEIHAPKKKWSESKYFASQQEEPVAAVTIKKRASAEPSGSDHLQHFKDSAIPNTSQRIEAPCPEITVPGKPLTIFLSIEIPRRLIRALENLIPGLVLVERDYNAHNTSVWRPGSVARSVIIPPMAGDADITVSPTAGIMIVNMLKIRQRPKADTNKNTIRVRIENTSLRYSQLIVLVGGEGGTDDVLLPLSSSDSAALAEFQGFAAGFDCDIRVHYIGGGDFTLAKWVSFCVCKYGSPDHGLQTNLLEMETLWELFLRRAGLNVYAAQAIVNQLKAPISNNGMPEPGSHGLSSFVTMTRAERLRRFGQLVGPRVLERVSMAVDHIWNRG